MISQCTAPEPAPRANQQVDSQSGCSFTSPSGFTSHHPIITPPNFNSSFNPNTRDQPCSSNLCPADSYRPNYPINGPRPSAREAAPDTDTPTGNNPSQDDQMVQDNRPADPNFHNLEFKEPTADPGRSREALLDTGATHHPTGDKERYNAFSWARLNSYDA
ncbi:hypothetical protein PSTG_05872 [Puccinia striiformis f. sp. tritici PST-78]|uniref:Uncharacterized protein n=1 Tax=Puccinia striiformis f. sp. tritici PST-78 TaxID=1165861 RepID=A0A0L0VNY7_9BASI|nr:hypothetical protein PSTG_05872 [Puccinia striiformis f. sp. tritici PST-78]